MSPAHGGGHRGAYNPTPPIIMITTGHQVFRSEWYTTSAPAERAAKDVVTAINWEVHTRAALQRVISERLATIAQASAALLQP